MKILITDESVKYGNVLEAFEEIMEGALKHYWGNERNRNLFYHDPYTPELPSTDFLKGFLEKRLKSLNIKIDNEVVSTIHVIPKQNNRKVFYLIDKENQEAKEVIGLLVFTYDVFNGMYINIQDIKDNKSTFYLTFNTLKKA